MIGFATIVRLDNWPRASQKSASSRYPGGKKTDKTKGKREKTEITMTQIFQ